MYIVTYCLDGESSDSKDFYRENAFLADEILRQSEVLCGTILESFTEFICKSGIEKLRSTEEYMLELLTLGTLWQVYSGDALGLADAPGHLLAGLSKMRQKGGTMKPGIDFLRGVLSTIFLSPDLYDNLYTLEPKTEHFEKLLQWLAATGEFNREVKRFRGWRLFLESRTPDEATDILATALTFAAWFELRSQEVLGKYTANVDRYLNEIRPNRYWREDVIFCGRRRVEYHLNMVGSEIMNRALREEFLKTARKLVLLPSCMRLLHENRCNAVEEGSTFRCVCCTKECNVAKLSVLGKKHGFEVAVVPHESSLSSASNDRSFIKPDTGVVGVACVLNLLSGGWMLREYGIAAQCVLLDYCGCKNHWHDEGLPTGLNTARLLQILDGDGEL